jgi:hypothetical protein
MDEIVFQVERDESGMLVASWDAPDGGGITTQARDLRELEDELRDAVRCHFDGDAPRRIRLHFTSDPVLINFPS